MPPQTIRKYWGPQKGRVHFNFDWPIINHDSVVLVTAAEYVESVPASNEHRFIGDASITVQNIAPHGPPYDNNHGVTFYVNIASNTPINVVTDITVLDPPVEGRLPFNFNWPIIDHDSTVLISACEYNNQRVRFIGDASITIEGIVPHGPPYDPNNNHGVTFYVDIQSGTPINVVTDITVLDNKPLEIDTYTPPAPNNIGVRMQYQESNQWCWIAVATSINHYYNPNSTWKQCSVMTDVGHRLNQFPLDTGACPAQKTIDDNPVLKAALADPYSSAAELILDDPRWGVDRRYLKTGSVKDPLFTTGNWARDLGSNVSLAQIAAEVNAGRPVAVDIDWNPGNVGQHVVAIAGVAGDSLLILDPVNGTSVMRFQNFPLTYFGGAKIIGYSFTKRA